MTWRQNGLKHSSALAVDLDLLAPSLSGRLLPDRENKQAASRTSSGKNKPRQLGQAQWLDTLSIIPNSQTKKQR